MPNNQRLGTSATASVLSEQTVVRLRQTLECEGIRLRAGQRGTVVSVYAGGEAYAVEFSEGFPAMIVITVPGEQLERI